MLNSGLYTQMMAWTAEGSLQLGTMVFSPEILALEGGAAVVGVAAEGVTAAVRYTPVTPGPLPMARSRPAALAQKAERLARAGGA